MNKKGFTLIELLAVIVILGIILGIAVPSVLGIIDKSKRDTHIKNAQIISSSIANVMASENSGPTVDGNATIYTLAYLTANNYLSEVKDPDGGTYNINNTYVVAHKTTTGMNYYVQLDGSNRDIGLTATNAANLSNDDVGTGTLVVGADAAALATAVKNALSTAITGTVTTVQ